MLGSRRGSIDLNLGKQVAALGGMLDLGSGPWLSLNCFLLSVHTSPMLPGVARWFAATTPLL
jgi:hypothetical protein